MKVYIWQEQGTRAFFETTSAERPTSGPNGGDVKGPIRIEDRPDAPAPKPEAPEAPKP